MTAVLVSAVLLVPGPVIRQSYVSRCHDAPIVACTNTPPPEVSAAPPALAAEPTSTTRAPTPTQLEPESPTSVSGSGVERWRTLVAAYFPPSQIETALQVMACESGGDPNAYNPSGASGLMQILSSWADNFGVLPDQLFDPETNIWIASELWADGGWTHWACA